MNTTEAVEQLAKDGYYSQPCTCGANPAWHLGHTQQCADEHVAKYATATTPCQHPENLNREESYLAPEGREHDVTWCGGCGDILSERAV